jgi:integrase
LRTVETVRLNIGDLRTDQGTAVIWVQGKGHAEADAEIVLGDTVEHAIRAYLDAAGRTDEPTNAPLFASTSNRNRGGRLTTRSIRNIAAQAFERVGVKSDTVTAHSLRHTTVTLALMGGATVQEVQQLARHASIDTTMIYAHNIERLEGKAEASVDAMLGLDSGNTRVIRSDFQKTRGVHTDLPAVSYNVGQKPDGRIIKFAPGLSYKSEAMYHRL